LAPEENEDACASQLSDAKPCVSALSESMEPSPKLAHGHVTLEDETFHGNHAKAFIMAKKYGEVVVKWGRAQLKRLDKL